MAHLQHQNLARGKWFTMTLAQQLGNVGSDFERALRWKTKQQQGLFTSAAARTLELLDLTLADPRFSAHRRRELARLRDEVCKELFSEEITPATTRDLQRYFLAMATLAQSEQRITK